MMNFIAGTVNALVLAAMVGVGAYNIETARAESRVKSFDDKEIQCLQQNIYFEARNQSTLGQVAVAWVTLNRVTDPRFPNTICGVVWDHKQFSWTHDGKADRPGKTELEQQAWRDAGVVATVTLLDWARGLKDPTQGADHYHADYTTVGWAKQGEKLVQIDNHIFYQVSW